MVFAFSLTNLKNKLQQFCMYLTCHLNVFFEEPATIFYIQIGMKEG